MNDEYGYIGLITSLTLFLLPDESYLWSIIPVARDGTNVTCPQWSVSTLPDDMITSYPYFTDFESGRDNWRLKST